MSWQLGAFVILALGLAGGFAWYERARPDARIVALVATLAAFAALGRIAFAALPNVKPTTDIVLIAGYALGGGPGFIVGAVAGLTSNFFFGQGPWTPWQMSAWGATGIIGAGLAVVTHRRIGRVPLALVCFVAGFAFAAFQDLGDWVNYSDHSLAQLGVYVGKGIGFDFVHAFACLGFALALGPALTRSVQRFAERLQVRWAPPGSVVAPALAAVAFGCGLGLPAPTAARAATPAGYLLAAQNGDGGFGPAPGQPSSQLFTGWAVLGLAAEGYNPRSVARAGSSAIDYIRAGAGSLGDPGSLERTILAVRAAGLSASDFGSENLVAKLEGAFRSDGSVSDQVNLTSFAVLALRAAGVAPSPGTISWLERQQDADGGFNFATAGGSSDVDDTGATVEALAGEGGTGAAVGRAIAFIRAQQNSDGGFASELGGPSNAQSTAWAVQGLIASGTDATSLHRAGAPSPLQYLNGLIASDGHVRYSSSSDQTPVWVTAEAAMALAGKPLPIIPPGPTGGSAPPTSAGPAGHSAAARAPGARRYSPRPRRTASPAALLTFAADAGFATAVVLAPIGLG